MKEYIEKQKILNFCKSVTNKEFVGAFNAFAVYVNTLPTVEAPTWVPCSERPPSEYGNYLITTEDGEVDIGTYDPDNGLKWSGCDADGFYWFSNGAILAWKPLPTAYKGEDNERML